MQRIGQAELHHGIHLELGKFHVAANRYRRFILPRLVAKVILGVPDAGQPNDSCSRRNYARACITRSIAAQGVTGVVGQDVDALEVRETAATAALTDAGSVRSSRNDSAARKPASLPRRRTIGDDAVRQQVEQPVSSTTASRSWAPTQGSRWAQLSPVWRAWG
jgi:hypothetical protein